VKNVGRFIRQIYRTSNMYSQQVLKDVEMTTSEIDVLRIAYHHESISQQDLSRRLGIDKAAVARLVSTLEAKGYIYRMADENDKRIKRICVTEPGEEAQAEARATEQEFYEWLFSDIGEAEQEIFLTVCEAVFLKAKEERKNNFVHLDSLSNKNK